MQPAWTSDFHIQMKWLGSAAPTGQMRAQRQTTLAGNLVVLKPQKTSLQPEPLAQLGKHCAPEGMLLQECCLHPNAAVAQVMTLQESCAVMVFEM